MFPKQIQKISIITVMCRFLPNAMSKYLHGFQMVQFRENLDFQESVYNAIALFMTLVGHF